MRQLISLCLQLATLLALALPAWAINITKSPAHYGQEMEYYYLKPRPEMLPDMLRAFDRSGQLANAEKRMFVASFLAALARQGDLKLEDFYACNVGPNGNLTLAWAAHLSGDKPLETQMLADSPAWLKNQLQKRPTHLDQWDPTWEKSVLGMFWAAFMATGSNKWLDAITDGALKHAHHNKGGSMVAASLYDNAPRHEAILRRLRERLPKLKDEEAQVVETILAHGEGKY